MHVQVTHTYFGGLSQKWNLEGMLQFSLSFHACCCKQKSS